MNKRRFANKSMFLEEFNKIMKDFLNDILLTFPEYKDRMTVDEETVLNGVKVKNYIFIVVKYILVDSLIYYTKMKKYLIKKK